MRWLVLAVALLSAWPAAAWDKHFHLTSAALAKEAALERTVTVVPLEQFLTQNFGAACTFEKARDAVFDGVGQHYQVFYQSQMPYTFHAEWEGGVNVLTLYPEKGTGPDDPQRLGGRPSARDVIVTYSDEPDWKMDDEVPRLVAASALPEASKGTATRALRHFWTPGEEMLGVKLDTGQETDKRMQLFYELALIAFESGHDYWGYRFLGNAVHYIEDMSQPYHTQLIINSDMLDMPVAIHRALCEVDRTLVSRFDAGVARCPHNESLSKAIIESGWYVGTYHGLFEDFGLALLEQNAFATRSVVLVDRTDVAPIVWRRSGQPLVDARSAISQAQRITLPYADETARASLATFGSRYVRSRERCELALRQMGQNASREYKAASGYYLPDPGLMNDSEFRQRGRLIELTHALQRLGAMWARQFIREATVPLTDEVRATVGQLRSRIAARCSGSAEKRGSPPKAR